MKPRLGQFTYVGDEVRDIEAAKRAGVPVVGVAWGFQTAKALESARPQFVAKTPEDLHR